MSSTPWIGHTVSWKNKLSDVSWTLAERVFCSTLTDGLAPTIAQGLLHHSFGHIDGAYIPLINLANKYVRIEATDIGLDFVGYVTAEALVRGPQEDDGGGTQRLFTGDQQFEVVGLEWWLAQQTVNFCTVHTANKIARTFGYNTGLGDGRDLTYAPLGNKDTRSNTFAADIDHTETWTAEEAVLNLLAEHGPKDKDGNYEPAEFQLSPAASDYLNWFAPIIETTGRSVWQILLDIISLRRGLVFWCEYDHAFGFVAVNVSSEATAPIVMPGGATLPAAATMVSLGAFNNEPSLQPIVRDRYDRRKDKVVCRGALRRSVFTVSFAAGTLETRWKAAHESLYRAGTGGTDPKVNDRFRQRAQYDPVYSMFTLPQDWNGLDGANKVFPLYQPSTGSIVGTEPILPMGLRLQRTMPLREGWDYTNATAPVNGDPTNVNSEWRKPFAILHVDDDPADKYAFAHKIGSGEEDLDAGAAKPTSYDLHILEGTPGLKLTARGGLNHTLAKGHFDPGGADAASNVPVEYDYATDLQVTVCAECDSFCEGQYPTTDPTSDPLRTIYISIGERARQDWLAKDTVIDIADGDLVKCTTEGNVRDDRKLCEDIARLAYEWYGIARAELAISGGVLNLDVGIGDLITTIGTGAALQTCNSIVSQITLDLLRGTTQIETMFAELDFGSL